MKKYKVILLLALCMMLFSSFLYGCGEGTTEDNESSENNSSGDEYEDYIHEALEAVKDKSQATDAQDTSGESTEEKPSNGRVIEIDRSDDDEKPESIFVSSEVADDVENKSDSSNESAASNTDSPGNSDSAAQTGTKEKTPATFEVGTGLVYIDGKYDDAYKTNLLKTINDARTGLNYPEMTINESLNTCANLRAKEITCYLSHQRPDFSMFYSLAPDYYKAEIITIDSASPKETLDAWMTDPISRNILFSKDFTSIGASNYVCNGLNCIVVSFGY